MSRRYLDDEHDDGYDDEVGYSYDSIGNSPSVAKYMYSRTGAPEEPEGDDDLIDEILAKVDHETIDMSLWTMTELTDIVRHFDYILNDVEAYLLRKMDEMQGQKASDDMFDLDEDSGLRSSKGSAGKKPSSVVGGPSPKKAGSSSGSQGGKKSLASSPKKSDSPSNGSKSSNGHGSKRSGSTPANAMHGHGNFKVVVKDAETALRGTKGLGHELLVPTTLGGAGFTSPLRESNSLSLSSEVNRSGSKSKLMKQMPDAKREKVLKELLAESSAGPSASNGNGGGGGGGGGANQAPKTHLNMVVIGHVDSGKSTTMGHLLYQLGHVEKKTIEKFEQESRNIGKATFHFAWVMDEQAEERARGVTIDVAVHPFETDRHKITILDAPGHQDFVPNMISGASQADVAVLVVNASDAEYMTILELGQAREHIVLARSLGVSQLIVAVNKLDTCEWQQSRFEFVRDLLLPFLKKSGFKENALQFIPTSGLSGENLTKRVDERLNSWYHGFSLIEAINNFQPAKRDLEKPFRMSVHDIFRDPHVLGLTVAGKIESGFLTTGDRLMQLPHGHMVTVKALRVGMGLVDRAAAGVNVEIGLLDIEEKALSIGDVLCDPMAPVPLIQKFQAQLVTFDLEKPILKGQNVIYYAANLNEAAVISKLVGICDQTGAIKQKNPRALTARVTALVEVTLKRKIPAELYKEFRGFGRFTVRDAGKTLAAGIITELEPSSSSNTPSASPTPSPAPSLAPSSSMPTISF
jgi:translation elongation factor TU